MEYGNIDDGPRRLLYVEPKCLPINTTFSMLISLTQASRRLLYAFGRTKFKTNRQTSPFGVTCSCRDFSYPPPAQSRIPLPKYITIDNIPLSRPSILGQSNGSTPTR